ncbi:Intracellular exo-alpha-(1-_5)-L-arabinofuranosidase 1 [Thermoflexales bacterium]|nr:Intracellular exo-alpha-(1->5)-L-arabinofuranosidase 1 [Thermoflexales bacterium]
MRQRLKEAPGGPPTREVGHGQGGRPKDLYFFILRPSLFSFLLLLLAACAIAPVAPTPVPTETAPQPMPGALFVNAANSIGPISPFVFGTNYGPWTFLNPGARPKAKEAGLTLMRYPGGNWGDLNDLMEYQLDEAVALAKELGAEPVICVRLAHGSVDNAVNLLKYANQTKKYNIKYWSIGNEPSLFATGGASIDGYETVRFNQEWRQFAEALRAVDPAIKLVGPDTHQFTANFASNPKDLNGKDWLEEFLKANGDLVDIVAVHRYPFPKDMQNLIPTKDELLASTEEWDQIIPALRKLIKDTTGQDKPIGIMEVNSNWANVSGGEASPETFYNALWWGDVLGRLIKQRVELVAQFVLSTAPGSGELGLFARDEPRLIYYVYPMYRRFGTQLVESSTDQALVSIYAALRADGALTLMVINRSDLEQTRPVQLHGFTPHGAAEVYRLDESHNAEKIESQQIHDGAKITLPPYSMTLYVLP